jgi:hypothetical protein
MRPSYYTREQHTRNLISPCSRGDGMAHSSLDRREQELVRRRLKWARIIRSVSSSGVAWADCAPPRSRSAVRDNQQRIEVQSSVPGPRAFVHRRRHYVWVAIIAREDRRSEQNWRGRGTEPSTSLRFRT